MSYDRLCLLLVSGFGSGLAPFAPGTFGTLPVAAIYVLITFSLTREPGQSGALAAVGLLASIITVALGPWAEKYFGRKDAQAVVLDEWAGYLLTALLWPVGREQPFLSAALVFVSFRVFDIVKFPPARQLEKLPHGWGVLLDDLASAVYAAGALWVGTWVLSLIRG